MVTHKLINSPWCLCQLIFSWGNYNIPEFPVTDCLGALHAASLDRHLRAAENHDDDGIFHGDHSGTNGDYPLSSGAASPLVEYTSHDELLEGENSDGASNSRNSVSHLAKSCDV